LSWKNITNSQNSVRKKNFGGTFGFSNCHIIRLDTGGRVFLVSGHNECLSVLSVILFIDTERHSACQITDETDQLRTATVFVYNIMCPSMGILNIDK
jgi:hypothetical protein